MKKISLKDNSKLLSRNEMRIITGGTNVLIKPSDTPSCGEDCTSDSFCSGNSSCPKCSSGKCA